MSAGIRRMFVWHWCFGLLGLLLAGCSTADNEMAAGSVRAVNHVDGTAINWFKVNGYRAHGGGGDQCCIGLPFKWRPGLVVNIEWEVDPDPFAKSPPLGTDEFRTFMDKHELNYRRYSTQVEIPEYQEKVCGLTVHFLACQQVKISTSCYGTSSPQYPIKDPRHMKEPAVCTK